MEKILKTDNAYVAIDKINANFDEAGSGGGEATKIEGSITGNGDSLRYFYFDAKPGDYLHIFFPDGDWNTTSQRDTYAKITFGWRDAEDTRNNIGYLCMETWAVQEYGYDLYVPDGITGMKDAYLGFRATSGTVVNFEITVLSKETMKPYFSDEMADTVAKIRARQGDATITLAICSDIHYRDIQNSYRPFAPFAMQGMGLTMKELARRIRLDNIVCLGDGIDGQWTAERSKLDARDLMRSFSGIDVPLLYAIGNHDDNRYFNLRDGDRRFTQQEIHAEFIQNTDERTSIGGAMQGCNYYRDIDRFGIRLIVLMSINFNGQYQYTTDTQNFLTSAFASMPQGYKAIIFTHTPLKASHSYSATSFPGGTEIETIIKNNLDKFLFMYFGHTHFDNTYMESFVEVNIGCMKVYNTESGTVSDTAPEGAYFCERAAGDYREQLWDAVVVDKTNALLSCIRFGSGPDRYIHLSPVEVAAGGTTTLTPSCITADSWETRTIETDISIASGTVTIAAGATSGSRLTAIAKDAEGNMEIWCVKVA